MWLGDTRKKTHKIKVYIIKVNQQNFLKRNKIKGVEDFL